MENYFVIFDYDNITQNLIANHIKKVNTREEAFSFPGVNYVIVMKSLGPKLDNELPKYQHVSSRTTFAYGYVYQYEILNAEGQFKNITWGKATCRSYELISRRSSYSDDQGHAEVIISDRFNVPKYILLKVRPENDVMLIHNIISFMMMFNEKYHADWRFYDLEKSYDYFTHNFEHLEKYMNGESSHSIAIYHQNNDHHSHRLFSAIIRRIEDLTTKNEANLKKIAALEEQIKPTSIENEDATP